MPKFSVLKFRLLVCCALAATVSILAIPSNAVAQGNSQSTTQANQAQLMERIKELEQQLAKLSDQLQCLLAAEGFTNEPAGGCRVESSVDPEHIAKIVQGVVGELKKRGMA